MTYSKARLVGSSLALTMGVAGLTLAGVSPSSAAQAHPVGSADKGAYLAPFYTEGDLTGDRQITDADLDLVRAALGTTSSGAGWGAIAAADLDHDGTITITDLARLAQKVVYDDGSFDLIEASALDMQKAMNAGVITSVQLTQDYLDRIAHYDAATVDTSGTGRPLNSIITTDATHALAAAAASDAARATNGHGSGMLDGIPILLKDNYDTADMPTSAGCSCWEHNQTATDATMVAGLRDAGAIILGKASMDEFAYGFVSQFSAGSAAGSSKYVASPYNTAQSAGGSSGGTGASISANLGAIGFGTDTGGSIRVPSSYNQLVGLRPTVGLTSRDGIVPLALSQDTGGPLARSVSDVAVALDAVVGSDPADAATAGTDSKLPDSYTSYLRAGTLTGKHFAYFTSMVPPATATNPAQIAARRIFLDAVQKLTDAGASVTAIDPATLTQDPDTGVTIAKILNEGSGSTNEFKANIADYVANHLDPTVTARSLADILASGQYVPSYQNTYAGRDNVTPGAYDTWMGTHGALITNGSAYLTGLMDDGGIDAMVYPTSTTYGTYSTNLRLSPNTGMPALTVPAGQVSTAEVAAGAPANANVNLEFLGRDYDEGDLISYGYSFEQATKARTTPALYGALPGETYTGPGVDTDAPGTGQVTITSTVTRPQVGQTFSVTVRDSAKDLYAYDLGLRFDPTAARLISTSNATGTTGSDDISTDTGTVHVVHTKLGSSPAAQGDTPLVTLTFKALTPGAANVALTRLVTVDPAGDPTTVVPGGGSTGGGSTGGDSGGVPTPGTPTPGTPTPGKPTPGTPTPGTPTTGTPGGGTGTGAAHATTTTVKLASSKVVSGAKLRLRVSVASVPGASATGKVRVTVGGVTKTVRLTGGRAIVEIVAPKLPRGVRSPRVRKVVVRYLPHAGFAGSTSVIYLQVTPQR